MKNDESYEIRSCGIYNSFIELISMSTNCKIEISNFKHEKSLHEWIDPVEILKSNVRKLL